MQRDPDTRHNHKGVTIMPMGDFRPAPKPLKTKKKKLLENGYKDKPQRHCYYTGQAGAERHEVYSGKNRQISIEYGFQVDLSPEIHARFHNPRTREDFDRIEYWEKKCQRDFETKLIYDKGMSAKSARACFMAIIGKNYLDPLG